MDKETWFQSISEQLEKLGTDPVPYAPQIDALAGILAQRDATRAEFDAEGASSLSEPTASGVTRKNPLRVAWDDLNKTALAYWREMGLTPASYKKVAGDENRKDKKLPPLAAALASLE